MCGYIATLSQAPMHVAHHFLMSSGSRASRMEPMVWQDPVKELLGRNLHLTLRELHESHEGVSDHEDVTGRTHYFLPGLLSPIHRYMNDFARAEVPLVVRSHCIVRVLLSWHCLIRSERIARDVVMHNSWNTSESVVRMTIVGIRYSEGTLYIILVRHAPFEQGLGGASYYANSMIWVPSGWHAYFGTFFTIHASHPQFE